MKNENIDNSFKKMQRTGLGGSEQSLGDVRFWSIKDKESEARHQTPLTQEDFDMGEKAFCEKYACNRAKYFRLKRKFKETGSVMMWTGYHIREVETIEGGGFPEDLSPEKLSKEAESQVVYFLQEAKEEILPNVVDDLRQEILVRFLELAGHEDFNRPSFRMSVSRNVVRGYLKNEWRARKKQAQPMVKIDDEGEGEEDIIEFDYFKAHDLKQEDVYFVDQLLNKVESGKDQLLLWEYLLYNTEADDEIKRIISENGLDTLLT
jgi:hypothetical protein